MTVDDAELTSWIASLANRTATPDVAAHVATDPTAIDRLLERAIATAEGTTFPDVWHREALSQLVAADVSLVAAHRVLARVVGIRSKYVAGTLLEALDACPRPEGGPVLDVDAVAPLTQHREWLIRHPATRALRLCDPDLAEPANVACAARVLARGLEQPVATADHAHLRAARCASSRPPTTGRAWRPPAP